MKKSPFLFIINPISGVGQQEIIEKMIQDDKQKTQNYPIMYTQYAGHGQLLAQENAHQFEVIVAVGGDGSINEIASGLMGSDCTLGILPCGSGNGLARFLGISTDLKKAYQQLMQKDSQKIDVIEITHASNPTKKYFFNVSGTGFDAWVSYLFHQNKGKRGLSKYVQIVLKEFFNYPEQNYTLSIDGKIYSHKAWLVAFANSGQFGNEVYISPESQINDGLLDVCFLQKPKAWQWIGFLFALMRKQIHNRPEMKIVRGKQIDWDIQNQQYVHIDGDYWNVQGKISFTVKPQSLNVKGLL